MKTPIYLDYQATTPVDPAVLAEMLPYFSETFGNAASRSHGFGYQAEAAVEKGRERVAGLIGAKPREIVFTSGATESDNLALKGVVEKNRDRGDHVITVRTEHKAVLDTGKYLEKHGIRVTYLPVDRSGLVDPGDVARAIEKGTLLVSVMHANNEIGVVQDIAAIGRICRERGVLFHTDATQGAGKLPLDVNAMNVDLASLSAHKMYGPKGVGALFVSRSDARGKCDAIIHGGGHERGLRSGTLNVPGIVGFGKAAEMGGALLPGESARLTGLRERLRRGIMDNLEEVHLNGHPERRLPGNLNISFPCVEGESLMLAMPEVAVSSGSACTSATLQPSYVLHAIGVPDEIAHTSIRFGLGRYTTAEEVDYVAARVVENVRRLRDMSPLWEMVRKGVDLSKVNWTGH